MLNDNLVLVGDSYKYSHIPMYPKDMTGMFSYLESRGGIFPNTLFVGLQYYLKRYLTQRVTHRMVDEAALFLKAHGEPFEEDSWRYLVDHHDGRFPVRIRAVPEGSLIPTHNVLMTIESTDPKLFWIVNYLETLLLKVWAPITISTNSFYMHRIIERYLKQTSDNPAQDILFALNDFGYRGVSSEETAGIAGLAHLVNSMGSDNIAGIRYANHYYNHPMAGFSIPASEHSTICSHGESGELGAFKQILNQYAKPGALVACVSDSYDLWRALEDYWGTELKQQIIDSGVTLVCRPDSGQLPDVVLKSLTILADKFGYTLNQKGYKVLKHVKLIQGDNVDINTTELILKGVAQLGFSTNNVALGCGGALLQRFDRDSLKMAFKCSAVQRGDRWFGVSKNPITDLSKRSKAGRLDLIKVSGEYKTVALPYDGQSEMQTVYKNGELLVETTFDEIRTRVAQQNP